MFSWWNNGSKYKANKHCDERCFTGKLRELYTKNRESRLEKYYRSKETLKLLEKSYIPHHPNNGGFDRPSYMCLGLPPINLYGITANSYIYYLM